jgi:hypothetical protein
MNVSVLNHSTQDKVGGGLYRRQASQTRRMGTASILLELIGNA